MQIETKITGIQFRGPAAQSVLGGVEAPFEFVLIREPSNRFDSNAIMVVCLHNENGEPRSVEAVEELVGQPRTSPDFIKACSTRRIGALHVGYVPKADNGPFAAAMDDGLPVRAFWSEHEAYGLVVEIVGDDEPSEDADEDEDDEE